MANYPVAYRKSSGGFQTGAKLQAGRDLRLPGDRDLLRFAERMGKERQSAPFRQEWKRAQKRAFDLVRQGKLDDLKRYARELGWGRRKTSRLVSAVLRGHPGRLWTELARAFVMNAAAWEQSAARPEGYDFTGWTEVCNPNYGPPPAPNTYGFDIVTGGGQQCFPQFTHPGWDGAYGTAITLNTANNVSILFGYRNLVTFRMNVGRVIYRAGPNVQTIPYQLARPGYRIPPGLSTSGPPWLSDDGPKPPPPKLHRRVPIQFRPGRQKERKWKPNDSRMYRALMGMFGAATEASDMVEALWEGMPSWMQARYKDAGTLSKGKMIFDQFHHLDLSKALYAYGKMQFEDAMIGLTKGPAAGGLSPLWDRPVGPTSGFFGQRMSHNRQSVSGERADWDDYLWSALGL